MRFYASERFGPTQSKTPEGFLVLENVPLARTGPQLYSDKEIPIKGDSTGRVIIQRDADEVFRPETVASLNGKPVAIDHPTEDVTPKNFRNILVGTVLNPRQGQGLMDNLLLGDLIIYSPEAIEAIQSKQLREVSVGYDANYVEDSPGKGHQTQIIANHLALVREGRCGPICRIGDSATYTKIRFGDSVLPQRRNRKMYIHVHMK